MKQFILSCTILLFSLNAAGQELAVAKKEEVAKIAAFSWKKMEHNFGKIEKGIPVTTEFQFTNSGEAPLIITEAKGSCGCTVTNYTGSMIKPGGTGMVMATFNASKVGAFSKSVTVTANTENGTERLLILGEVLAKD